MKKTLFTLLLLIAGSVLQAQPVLGVYENTFQDVYLIGDPLDATILLKNTGNQTFNGDVDIYVNAAPASTPSFLQEVGIISLNNISVAPYEDITVDLSVFTVSQAHFVDGGDIVIIWPKVTRDNSGGSTAIGDTLHRNITVTYHATSQLDDIHNIKKIKVYPTLAQDRLQITNYGYVEELSLYTLDGKLIKHISPAPTIFINDLSEGAYYLILKDSYGKRKIVPFLIQR